MQALRFDSTGHKVELKLKNGKILSGVIWHHDPVTEVVVLQSPSESGTPGSSDVRLVKLCHIAELVSHKPPVGPVDKAASLPDVDLARLKKREARAIQLAEEKISSIGVGVSEKAQALFDALVKTMPCKWSNTSIEIHEAVVVEPPYTPDCCKALGDTSEDDTIVANMIDRVKTVLTEERKRLELDK